MKLAGKKKNYNHSLLLKVLFIYFLIFAVPIILLYASLYGTSKRLAQKEGASQLLSSLTSISNTMDEVFRSVNFVQSQLQGNTAFSNDCFRLTVDESAGVGYRNYRLRQELSMELYKLYLSNPYLHSLEVYSSYGNTLFGNYPGNSRQITVNPTETQIENIRQNAQKTGLTGNRAWYVLSSDPEQTLFATYSRPFCAFNPNMYTYSRALSPRKPFTTTSRSTIPARPSSSTFGPATGSGSPFPAPTRWTPRTCPSQRPARCPGGCPLTPGESPA